LRDVVVSRSNAFCLSNVERRASLSIAHVSFCLSVVRLPVVPVVGVVLSITVSKGKKNREKKKCVFVE